MTDLLTQPAMPQVPAAAYASKLASPGMNSDILNSAAAATASAPAIPAVVADAPYVVISVSMQFDRWSAVLGNQGKLYNVSVGDNLSDGSTVVSINKTSVVLSKDDRKRKLSIQTSI